MDSDSSSTIEVTVEAASWLSAVTDPEGLCRRVVSLVVAREAPDLADRAEVGVVLTDDARVRALNAAYRGKDKPTNVLSFPGRDPDDPLTDGPVLLGDVVVAFETTAAEAAEAGKPVQDHLTHLLVHGTLHLLGHDHEVDLEAEAMEALEVTLLASLGVPDPYVAGSGTVKALPKREQPSPSLIESFLRRVRDLAWRSESDSGDLKVALEELIEEVEDETGTAFSVEERELVKNALGFGELRVDDVMIPRADIKGIPAGSPLRAVIEAIKTGGHSRLVVFRETLDDIVGVIHIRDLLPYWGDGDSFSLEQSMRPVLVVPPSMRVIDLLLEMRATRNHLAVVVDEFGGTDGLVTIEDLVQEIVGEVQDEHDRVGRPRLTRNPDGGIDVDGRLYLEELEKELGFELLDEEDRDEADTVGGLIFTLLDRVPSRGEKVSHPAGVEFEILDADPRRIKRIRVRPVNSSAGGDAEPPTG